MQDISQWKEELEKLAFELTECSDIMPTTLAEHQSKVYNACLDMIYRFDTLLHKAITEERKKFEATETPGEGAENVDNPNT